MTTASLTRQLGNSNLQISALGMGCWAIGGPFWSGATAVGWGKVDDDESIRSLQRALELGVNFFDTADVYGAGHSERILGRALAGHRHEVVIATKFCNMFDEVTKQSIGQDDSPEYIREACEASLRRLNTDYIDLYQFHWNGYQGGRAAEVRDTLESLVAAGKIRYYGWSTDFPDHARIFAEGEHCAAMQFTLNVMEDSPDMIALCEEHNFIGINRGPLAMGLLTGKFTASSTLPGDDIRGQHHIEWMQYFKEGKPSPEWLAKLDSLREVLTSGGRTLAQGALAWIWGRSSQMLPIPGFKTVAQVEENCGALKFGALTPDQMRDIDTILGRSVEKTAAN